MSRAWAKIKSLLQNFCGTFDYNVMSFVIIEQFYRFKLFLRVVLPKYRKYVQNSHIFKVFLYLYIMNIMEKVILQIRLLKFFTAEILRTVLNITNLLENQQNSTKNYMKQVAPQKLV